MWPMRTRRRRLVSAALLALALHINAVFLAGVLMRRWAPSAAELRARAAKGEPEAIEITALDDDAARRIVADLERMQAKQEEAEIKKEQESPVAPGQVVDLPPPPDPSRPDHARYVSEHDSSVQKETKKMGRFDDRAAAAREARRSPTPPSPSLLAMRSPEPASPRTQGRASPGRMRPLERSPEALPRSEDGALPGAPPPSPAPSMEPPGSPGRPPGAVALLPSERQLAQAIGGGTQDHLPEVEEGDSTALNSRSWKFASFFNRVKRQVAEHWKPAAEYGRRDPTGQIYGSGHWVTFLRIVLKPDGALSSVVVTQSSGIEFLDDVAVEAIKMAQPYPNPPPQLVDPASGVLSFKFGFFFDVGSGSRMKIYRYPAL
jgi:TonB family protein